MAPFHMPRFRPQTEADNGSGPRIDHFSPAAALPLGEIEVSGANLGPLNAAPPVVTMDGVSAHLLMCRPSRIVLQVPAPATTGMLEVRTTAGAAHAGPVRVA